MTREIDRIIYHAEQSEKMIERYLVSRVEALGGFCLKYSNSNMIGFPDRLAILPHGKTVWFELKSKGCQPSKAQVIRFLRMGQLGHPVFVCDSKQDVDDSLKNLGYAI